MSLMNATYVGEVDTEMVKAAREVPLDMFRRMYKSWLWKTLGFTEAYETLFDVLVDTRFEAMPDVPFDEHRVADGIDLRRIYSAESGYECEEASSDPCSVLEVLMSMAVKADNASINVPYSRRDDRTGVRWWFWAFIGNLGLSGCRDGSGTSWRRPIENSIRKWMRRQYKKDGTGGIFPIPRTHKDQRTVELWYQLNEYLISNEYV